MTVACAKDIYERRTMKQKVITLICALLCLALFASSIFVFEGYGQGYSHEDDAATPHPTAGHIPAQQAGALALPTPTTEPAPTALLEESDLQGRNFTTEEVTILAQVLYKESAVLAWYGERFGVSYQARQAAVAWCALNRLDAGTFGATLKDVLTAPYQFAYEKDAPVTDDMLWLAEDVLRSWNIEHITGEDAGRTLPVDYLYFEGDGVDNYFRKEYQDTGVYWDWSLSDPYKKEA